ncbi:hypothetical protein RGQ29_010789 [Quercus rubra]|uniref:Uncharacterized protein n=1 Tax=Quercus rubra TaxID=3512 RepID=A0AAN7G4J9_QUERU|nr:hypothetical protein RGQ29_010789 [Quercus rubra]
MLNNGAPSIPANTNITTEQIQKILISYAWCSTWTRIET